MKNRRFGRASKSMMVLLAGTALGACGAGPDAEGGDQTDPARSASDSDLKLEGCPAIGPGCSLPPLTLPNPCFIVPANASLTALPPGHIAQSTSPDNTYGSACGKKWLVDFFTAPEHRYTMNEPPFWDLPIGNALADYACTITHARIDIYGWRTNTGWSSLGSIGYHGQVQEALTSGGVTFPKTCVAALDSSIPPTLTGYSKIRIGSVRYRQVNSTTEYLTATSTLTAIN